MRPKQKLLLIATVMLLSVAWWWAYVHPRDGFRMWVLDCMGDDQSEAAFRECVLQWRNVHPMTYGL